MMLGNGQWRRFFKRPRFVLITLAALFLSVFFLICFLAVSSRVRLENPRPTPIIQDRYGVFLTEGLEEYDQLGFWDMPEELPERITRALLAVEDKRFFRHRGIDLRSVGRSLLNNLSDAPVQGASTIAMQVARLQDPAPRTLGVKIREIITARRLIGRFGRDSVLRHYMKIVPLGHQIHGFSYAARRYFRKPVEDLSWAEAALLAALPKSPSKTDLFSPMGLRQAKKRAILILDLLAEEGDIDKEEYSVSRSLLAEMHIPRKEIRPVEALHFIERFLQQKGLYRDTYSAPLRSSLDLSLQSRAVLHLREFLERNAKYGAENGACIVLDTESGEILAYAGSTDYFSSEAAGGINYAYTPRSSGSILKPFMFAYGLQSGTYTSGSILADIPLHWMDPKGEYIVKNYDGEYLGPLLYGNALANSRNITSVRVLDRLGPERVFDLFRQMNFHDGSVDWEYYGFGLVLGGLYVRLEDVVRSYGYLASDGNDFALRWTISPPEGRLSLVSDERGLLPSGMLNEDAVRLVTGYLSDPTRRLPSFPRLSNLEFPFPVAIKTGTSQGYRDAWAVGFSRRYVIGVWIGRPDNEPMNHVAGSTAAELVHDLFLDFQPEDREGFDVPSFPPPRDAVALEISPLSGKIATRHNSRTQVEYFVRGTEPVEFCNAYQPFSIDRRTGDLAGPGSPQSEVVTRFLPVLPQEYDAWSKDHGYTLPPQSSPPPNIASVSVRYPIEGARFIIDPTIPEKFQTLGFEALVEPRISEVVWYVDGEEFGRSAFPYVIRWPLKEGIHTVQVRFPNAFIQSSSVTFRVM